MDPDIRIKYLPAYHVRVSGPEKCPDGTWVMTASFTELPQCLAQAPTAQEAVERLWDGLPAFIDMLKEHGQSVPDAVDDPAPRSHSANTPGVRITLTTTPVFPRQFATA